MSDNKYMAFSMQIFLIFSLVIIGTVVSAKLLTLRVSTSVLTHSHIYYYLLSNKISYLLFIIKKRYKRKRSICFHCKSKKVKFRCLGYDKYIHKECLRIISLKICKNK
jgi:hypothetical protein